jgi:predicted transcriptional regulator of viral defense system
LKTLETYTQLKELDVPVLRTGEVARHLHTPDSTAHSALQRLSQAGLVKHVWRGVWTLQPELDPLVLPPYLTGAFPSYVSFETALFYHEMIQQIPPRITVASLHRSTTIRTTLGTYLVHQLPPALFGGFEERNDIRMATLEKAVVDLAYIRSHRGWKSTRMPEIELPDGFRVSEVANWVDHIPAQRMRTLARGTLASWGIPTEARSAPSAGAAG